MCGRSRIHVCTLKCERVCVHMACACVFVCIQACLCRNTSWLAAPLERNHLFVLCLPRALQEWVLPSLGPALGQWFLVPPEAIPVPGVPSWGSEASWEQLWAGSGWHLLVLQAERLLFSARYLPCWMQCLGRTIPSPPRPEIPRLHL